MPMAHPFFMGITFPADIKDIKQAKSEKSISAGQIRYAIRIIYMYGKKSPILDLQLRRFLRNKK